MPKTIPINVLCEEFITYLSTKTKQLDCISKLQSGFEDWLKFEFCNMCTKKDWNWSANNQFGVEYCAHLKDVSDTKTIDIWTYGNEELWNYIELKVVFNNLNKNKQFGSWVDDYESLKQLNDNEKAFGIASIILGIDFEEREWMNAIKKILPSIDYEKSIYGFIAETPIRYAILFQNDVKLSSDVFLTEKKYNMTDDRYDEIEDHIFRVGFKFSIENDRFNSEEDGKEPPLDSDHLHMNYLRHTDITIAELDEYVEIFKQRNR